MLLDSFVKSEPKGITVPHPMTVHRLARATVRNNLITVLPPRYSKICTSSTVSRPHVNAAIGNLPESFWYAVRFVPVLMGSGNAGSEATSPPGSLCPVRLTSCKRHFNPLVCGAGPPYPPALAHIVAPPPPFLLAPHKTSPARRAPLIARGNPSLQPRAGSAMPGSCASAAAFVRFRHHSQPSPAATSNMVAASDVCTTSACPPYSSPNGPLPR